MPLVEAVVDVIVGPLLEVGVGFLVVDEQVVDMERREGENEKGILPLFVCARDNSVTQLFENCWLSEECLRFELIRFKFAFKPVLVDAEIQTVIVEPLLEAGVNVEPVVVEFVVGVEVEVEVEVEVDVPLVEVVILVTDERVAGVDVEREEGNEFTFACARDESFPHVISLLGRSGAEIERDVIFRIKFSFKTSIFDDTTVQSDFSKINGLPSKAWEGGERVAVRGVAPWRDRGGIIDLADDRPEPEDLLMVVASWGSDGGRCRAPDEAPGVAEPPRGSPDGPSEDPDIIRAPGQALKGVHTE